MKAFVFVIFSTLAVAVLAGSRTVSFSSGNGYSDSVEQIQSQIPSLQSQSRPLQGINTIMSQGSSSESLGYHYPQPIRQTVHAAQYSTSGSTNNLLQTSYRNVAPLQTITAAPAQTLTLRPTSSVPILRSPVQVSSVRRIATPIQVSTSSRLSAPVQISAPRRLTTVTQVSEPIQTSTSRISAAPLRISSPLPQTSQLIQTSAPQISQRTFSGYSYPAPQPARVIQQQVIRPTYSSIASIRTATLGPQQVTEQPRIVSAPVLLNQIPQRTQIIQQQPQRPTQTISASASTISSNGGYSYVTPIRSSATVHAPSSYATSSASIGLPQFVSSRGSSSGRVQFSSSGSVSNYPSQHVVTFAPMAKSSSYSIPQQTYSSGIDTKYAANGGYIY